MRPLLFVLFLFLVTAPAYGQRSMTFYYNEEGRLRANMGDGNTMFSTRDMDGTVRWHFSTGDTVTFRPKVYVAKPPSPRVPRERTPAQMANEWVLKNTKRTPKPWWRGYR